MIAVDFLRRPMKVESGFYFEHYQEHAFMHFKQIASLWVNLIGYRIYSETATETNDNDHLLRNTTR